MACCLRAKEIEAGKRRTLYPSAGDDNRRVINFLSKYVLDDGDEPEFGPKCFCLQSLFFRRGQG